MNFVNEVDETICCGKDMTPTGLDLGNGWLCEICGREFYDVASVKMSGNYEEYLRGNKK